MLYHGYDTVNCHLKMKFGDEKNVVLRNNKKKLDEWKKVTMLEWVNKDDQDSQVAMMGITQDDC